MAGRTGLGHDYTCVIVSTLKSNRPTVLPPFDCCWYILELLEVEAAGVNPSDTYLRLGMSGPYAAVPHLLPPLAIIWQEQEAFEQSSILDLDLDSRHGRRISSSTHPLYRNHVETTSHIYPWSCDRWQQHGAVFCFKVGIFGNFPLFSLGCGDWTGSFRGHQVRG